MGWPHGVAGPAGDSAHCVTLFCWRSHITAPTSVLIIASEESGWNLSQPRMHVNTTSPCHTTHPLLQFDMTKRGGLLAMASMVIFMVGMHTMPRCSCSCPPPALFLSLNGPAPCLTLPQVVLVTVIIGFFYGGCCHSSHGSCSPGTAVGRPQGQLCCSSTPASLPLPLTCCAQSASGGTLRSAWCSRFCSRPTW